MSHASTCPGLPSVLPMGQEGGGGEDRQADSHSECPYPSVFLALSSAAATVHRESPLGHGGRREGPAQIKRMTRVRRFPCADPTSELSGIEKDPKAVRPMGRGQQSRLGLMKETVRGVGSGAGLSALVTDRVGMCPEKALVSRSVPPMFEMVDGERGMGSSEG
jgi:hypothetical protein